MRIMYVHNDYAATTGEEHAAEAIVHISRFTWGKCAALLYACLVAVSLFHFYFQPETYSRRSNITALNSFLRGTLNNDDCLIDYHWRRGDQPHYLTVFDKTTNSIDLFDDRPEGVNLAEYISSLNAACGGKIYLICASPARQWVDPNDSVMSFLKSHRDSTVRCYGRNLSLFVFTEAHEAERWESEKDSDRGT